MPLIATNRKESDGNRRHWTVAIFLQLGIRLRYLYESWCGIYPLYSPLTDYPSPFRPKNAPHYDLFTRWGFVWLWFTTALLRDYLLPYVLFCKLGIMNLFNGLHTYLTERLEKQMAAAGYTQAQREVPIPTFEWEKGDPKDFYNTFVKRPHPVVLKGFMKGQDLLKNLNFDTVIEKYGEEEVFLTKKELDGFPGKLKEVQNDKVYLHNSEKLFCKYPEIKENFQYERLEPFLNMKVGYEQIFVGKEGTGSPFHHASVYNMFYMVDGKKTWWFIDPYDTFLAYPVAVLGNAAGILLCLWPNEYNVEAFPLFKYCPVYTATLEPGDVLFNPPWWWHSIKNVTPKTVGVASRWHTDGIVGHKYVTSEEDYNIYKLGSLFFMTGLKSWNFLHGILQTPSPKYDEHLTLREVKNRYVHTQIKHSEAGGVNAFGAKVKM